MTPTRKAVFESIFIVFFLITLVAGGAIYSFAPTDPSVTRVTYTGDLPEVKNLFGLFGAWLADWHGIVFGWTALFVPLIHFYMALQAVRMRLGRVPKPGRPMMKYLLMVLSVIQASLLTGMLAENDPFFLHHPAGGALGLYADITLRHLIGPMGVIMTLGITLTASLMVLTKVSITDIIRSVQTCAEFIRKIREQRAAKRKAKEERELARLENLERMKKSAASTASGAAASAAPATFATGGGAHDAPSFQRMGVQIDTTPKAETAPAGEQEYPATQPVLTGDELSALAGITSTPDAPDAEAEAQPVIRTIEQTPPAAPVVTHASPAEKSPVMASDAFDDIDIRPAETITTVEAVPYAVPISLLTPGTDSYTPESPEELRRKADLLTSKLSDYQVFGTVREIQPGPVVTQFEYEPAPGIKINKIANLDNDLALAMRSTSIRIIAPIPGKSAVGIEIPNAVREKVFLGQLLRTPEFINSASPLTVALGKDISGRPYIADLAKMPHLLVAGTTGSGKSVSINTMICSLLYKASPDMVKLVMIDPKMVELSVYSEIPHLAAPVVVDPRQAAAVLRNVVAEMEARYALLASRRVRNIDSYNKQAADDATISPMPYLVVIVDEFADLMMVAGKEVEQSIIRIAQMARAVGIHLVLATQRPSVNIITGIIKANMPSRLSFKVSSKIDSRTVLDQNGAELLLGQGDSLFLPPGSGDLVRIHGCFVSEEEVNSIVDHLKTMGEPEYNMDLVKDESADGDDDGGDVDVKYEEALALVREKGFASASMIQRYLRIGYNRASRIVEVMEKRGIVSPSDGSSRPRELLKRD